VPFGESFVGPVVVQIVGSFVELIVGSSGEPALASPVAVFGDPFGGSFVNPLNLEFHRDHLNPDHRGRSRQNIQILIHRQVLYQSILFFREDQAVVIGSF
jgi:integral membrane sensor domain MASE1